MKRSRNSSHSPDFHDDLTPKVRKSYISPYSPEKTVKIIPIKDPYIAKILTQNQKKLLKDFSEKAASLSVDHKLKIE